MPIGGANYNNIIIPRNARIGYAVAGFPFNHATQGGVLGIRKNGKLSLPTIARRDAIGRDQFDAKNAMIEVELWQDNFQSLYNVYLLSKGNHQLQFQLANGDWYNFVDNSSGGVTSPNGSALVGMTASFEATSKELAIKCNWATKMHPKEYDWLLANAGSAASGGVSGAANSGMTSMLYNQAEYGVPGFLDILFNGDSVGVIGEGTKLTLNFKEMVKTVRDQPVSRLVEVIAEVEMLQGSIGALQAVTALRNSDFTTKFKLWNGITMDFVNSLSVVDAPEFDDTKTMNKLTLAGVIPYDPYNVQNNIIWNVGTQTVTFNRIGYV